jgi:hypothetical protein
LTEDLKKSHPFWNAFVWTIEHPHGFISKYNLVFFKKDR